MNFGASVKSFLSKGYFLISYILKRILFLAEFFLFLRLLLKFFSANPQAPVVDFIYRYSDFLVSPFRFIFPDFYWRGTYLIETAAISAMVGYVIITFVIFYLLKLFSQD